MCILGRTDADLQASIDKVSSVMDSSDIKFLMPREENYPFHRDPKKSKLFWDVRKGLIPIVGAGRREL